MSTLAIALSLSLLLPVAAPVQALAGGFSTLERCENYIARSREHVARRNQKQWNDVVDLFAGAYCEPRDGGWFVVYPWESVPRS